MKKISEFFLAENFQFLEVNFSMYLNRRVFVMQGVAEPGDGRGTLNFACYMG